ncbi:hypothetical protein [Methyloceanibacter sp.]|uniref:hypothetical protein n=1 Tax=Methyloceanibacter sp. TaxID=1965321 RepID=UPI003D6D8896
MLAIFWLDRHVADVELGLGGELVVTGEPWVSGLLENMRHWRGEILLDAELYLLLPHRLKGHLWAGWKTRS